HSRPADAKLGSTVANHEAAAARRLAGSNEFAELPASGSHDQTVGFAVKVHIELQRPLAVLRVERAQPASYKFLAKLTMNHQFPDPGLNRERPRHMMRRASHA